MSDSYRPYPAYKASGEDWLGEIPVEWRVIRVGHLSPVKRGASPRPIDDAKYFDDEGEYAWTRIADVTKSDVYLQEAPQRLSDLGSSLSVKLEPGELFLSIAATVGKPCITGIKACIHDGFVYFPELKIPAKFLFYIFAAGYAFQGLGKMGTQLNLNTDTVGKIKVGVGLKEELEKIVQFLDHETATIDALIEKQQQLIALLEEKRQAVISHAVTKGLNPDAPMRDSGVEWLGQVPAHWAIDFKLLWTSDGSKGSFVNGPFGSDLLASELKNRGVPVIYIRDIKPNGYKRKSTVCVTPQKAIQLDVCRVVPGDVLVAKVGDPPGDACVYPSNTEKAVITQDVIRIRVDRRKINSYFLATLLNSNFGRILVENVSVESTRKRVGLGDFKQVRFALPPLEEQKEISRYIERELRVLRQLVHKAEDGIELLKERRTALISAAVTGKIDVRHWTPPAPKTQTPNPEATP